MKAPFVLDAKRALVYLQHVDPPASFAWLLGVLNGFLILIQLAHRTGKYVALHAGKVYEGELRGFNLITGEPELGENTSSRPVGLDRENIHICGQRRQCANP